MLVLTYPSSCLFSGGCLEVDDTCTVEGVRGDAPEGGGFAFVWRPGKGGVAQVAVAGFEQ